MSFRGKLINLRSILRVVSVGLLPILLAGCAEGPFWRTGHLSPWAREKWEQEEAIASSLFRRKQELTAAVDSALAAGPAQRDSVANRLGNMLLTEPVLLVRLHAIRELGRIPGETSFIALKSATSDSNYAIRIAAVDSLSAQPPGQVVPVLQEVIGSDTNRDVRMAAIRVLGEIPGAESAQALELALEDPDPAMQVLATESLAAVTGKNLGPDVMAWKNHLRGENFSQPATNQDATRMARQPDGSNSFRR